MVLRQGSLYCIYIIIHLWSHNMTVTLSILMIIITATVHTGATTGPQQPCKAGSGTFCK